MKRQATTDQRYPSYGSGSWAKATTVSPGIEVNTAIARLPEEGEGLQAPDDQPETRCIPFDCPDPMLLPLCSKSRPSGIMSRICTRAGRLLWQGECLEH